MVTWLHCFGPMLRQSIGLNHIVEGYAYLLAARRRKEKEVTEFGPRIPFKNVSTMAMGWILPAKFHHLQLIPSVRDNTFNIWALGGRSGSKLQHNCKCTCHYITIWGYGHMALVWQMHPLGTNLSLPFSIRPFKYTCSSKGSGFLVCNCLIKRRQKFMKMI